MQIDKWNDQMFVKHPTPYGGLAGIIEKIRVLAVQKYANCKAEDKILEIGCEAGNLLIALPQSRKMVGFDISRKALKEAEVKIKQAGKLVRFVQGDAMEALPFRKGEFSLIICSETLEHVLNPIKVIENIARICDENTRVILTVPNEKPKIVIKQILSRLRFMQIAMPSIEKGQSEWHLHAFSRGFLLSMVEKHFQVVRITGLMGLHVMTELRVLGHKRTRGKARK